MAAALGGILPLRDPLFRLGGLASRECSIFCRGAPFRRLAPSEGDARFSVFARILAQWDERGAGSLVALPSCPGAGFSVSRSSCRKSAH